MLRRTVLLLLVLVGWGGGDVAARADGGTVRASQRVNGHQVTVFTDPTPLLAGKADVSVLVQDAQGRPLPDVPVEVRAWPVGSPLLAVGGPATTEAATNKLLRAIPLTLSEPGRWQLDVTADVPDRPVQLTVLLDVAEPLPSWYDLAGWIGWPIIPIGLFLLRELRSRR